jgi:lysozyme
MPSKLTEPWKIETNPLLIDAYYQNPIDWDEMAKDQRVVGIIHKANAGGDGLGIDRKYHDRRKEAKSRGYLWGSYHLAQSGDPIRQAKHYLDVIEDADDELMSLDLEDTNDSRRMDIAGARKFLEYVLRETGRLPYVYANQNVTKLISREYDRDSIFGKTKLWYAWFRPSVQTHPANSWNTYPTNIWSEYTLWQFGSEINCKPGGSCPYRVRGTNHDMDVNVFHGTLSQLKAVWSV